MIDRLLLVSTCGTSLLFNDANEGGRAWLTRIANDVEVDRSRLEALVADRRSRVATADEFTRCTMSAELNAIRAILQRYRPRHVFHLLVHTDTAVGRTTVELVREALGSQTALVTAGGLRTNDLVSFRAALPDLTKQLDELVQACRSQGWFVVFNLTGGFKSLNAYLQTLAMISADRCAFLFEGAPEVMEIPRLPVRLCELEHLRDHLEIFRRLSVDYSVSVEAAVKVPESLLMVIDGEVTTSPLGDVVWSRHQHRLFAERLYPTLSRKVHVSQAVQKAFADLEAKQKVQVNDALDEFSAFVDNSRPLPKSRTFKKLQGDPVPGSTHELYAWSDGSTGRLFGHYDAEGSFVFDRLSNHLP